MLLGYSMVVTIGSLHFGNAMYSPGGDSRISNSSAGMRSTIAVESVARSPQKTLLINSNDY